MTAPATPATPLIAEDLLLLLFDPRSGTIAGENTLFYTLAGAVLTELAVGGHVEIDSKPGLTGNRVTANAGSPPADPLLRERWDLLVQKPRGAQTFLAEVGPYLREPLLDRLVERGHVGREKRKALGFIPTTALTDGGTPRRAELVAAVRPVLADGAVPAPRTAVLGALLSASGSLPVLDKDIPWSGAVYTRGKELEQGDWGASAAGEAVVRTTIAVTVSSAAIAFAAVQNP
ncbi:GOLPH3/VPS74 family protein [Promicromonospora sukumoe]|uniref:GOLPH3/VPS74 family protein n=1 Tax=Promicromonospora sukumoe TaxID=88382 RepID=UPI0003731FD8|nr:GPP34 family phosphoprotein [Promicromonospora sukumoe]